MKVKELKKILNDLDDDLDVFIRNSINLCGNISDLAQIQKSEYSFFGTVHDCIILNSCENLKEVEDEEGYIISENYIEDKEF